MGTTPTTMRAAVIRAWNEIHVEEVPVPSMGPGEVLCRVRVCGICPTDLKLVEGAYYPTWPPSLPFIFGHEWVAEVAAVGEEVTKLEVGDRVCGVSLQGCGQCKMCRTGRQNLCLRAGESTEVLYGFTANGAFAEYLVREPGELFRLPDNISFTDGVIISEGPLVLHAVNRVGIEPGDSVAIAGSGLAGLLAVQMCRTKGATNTIVIGFDHGLRVAKELGADHIIDITREDPAKVVPELTGGIGADVGMECSGSTEALAPLMKAVRRGAKIAVIGLNGMKQVPIVTDRIVLDEVDLIGVRVTSGELSNFIALMASGRVTAKGLVTHTFPLEEINEAMDLFRERRDGAIRVAITI